MDKVKTIVTKSGLFIKNDPLIGQLIFSPFSGAVFASPKEFSGALLSWLNLKSNKPPTEAHYLALGAGWCIDLNDAIYPTPNLLPNSDSWSIISCSGPIMVNWLITGNCPLACSYCYAEDLMRNKHNEPVLSDIPQIANEILRYSPLVVVLTGGDPLLSPYLEQIANCLHKKTGLVLDTSGFHLSEKHIIILKKYNIYTRISIDSENPAISKKLRPLHGATKNQEKSNSLYSAISTINRCVEAGIRVGVQSVATNINVKSLESLGEKLFKMGITGWRILMLAPSKTNYEQYQRLSIDNHTNIDNMKYLNRIINKHHNAWMKKVTIQITKNNVQNSVLLVSPSGEFYTESNLPHAGKKLIDASNPKCPQNDIHKKMSMHAHAERYLNI